MVDKRSRTGKKSVRRAPRMSPAHRGTIRLTLVLSALVLVNCYVFLWRDSTSIPAVMQKANAIGEAEAATAVAPAPVDERQLRELHIRLRTESKT